MYRHLDIRYLLNDIASTDSTIQALTGEVNNLVHRRNTTVELLLENIDKVSKEFGPSHFENFIFESEHLARKVTGLAMSFIRNREETLAADSPESSNNPMAGQFP